MVELLTTALLTYVMPLLGTLGVTFIFWLLRTKFKLQITVEQERVLSEILRAAIGFANEWAHKQLKAGAPVTGEAKMEQAVTFAKAELARVKIAVPEKQVNAMLHAALGVLRKMPGYEQV